MCGMNILPTIVYVNLTLINLSYIACIAECCDFHLIEKTNGIAHEYAWLDKHPDVRLDSYYNVL